MPVLVDDGVGPDVRELDAAALALTVELCDGMNDEEALELGVTAGVAVEVAVTDGSPMEGASLR